LRIYDTAGLSEGKGFNVERMTDILSGAVKEGLDVSRTILVCFYSINVTDFIMPKLSFQTIKRYLIKYFRKKQIKIKFISLNSIAPCLCQVTQDHLGCKLG
jgi:hypothetical protein